MGVVGISPPQGAEWLLILAVLVLLFGARKLPELGSSIGRTITNFKKGVAEGRVEDDEQAHDDGQQEATAGHAADSASDERDSSGS